MTRPRKIALTGAHGTGKTTLVSSVARLVSGRAVQQTPEVPRLFVDELGDPTFFQRANNTFLRQTMILGRQIELEGALTSGEHDLMLCDRTIVDHWAYTEVLFPAEASTPEGQSWSGIVQRWAKTYSRILHVPIEFPVKADGVRENDEKFQRDIDRKLIELYARFGITTGTISGAAAEREKQLLEEIRKLEA